ncbi:branched-chain amino acid ABC transporter permease [Candidimonas nitroreducens]|uniref:Branched-chain amino acid ABC transporter permease n=1 Tax=Candidimonas nitroreducens TaxID=683354 RepID=A0A225MRL7_9BURK|nr:branched-chain amino acid ABC transporter permease [Candidimonas nitroreducens]OWT63934.1 hypothetical protein CEY11_06430 [Candidimonas nitroreducens]
MATLNSRWTVPLAIAIVVCIVGLNVNPYLQFMLSRILIYILLSLGLNVLMGYTGLLSFAHAALFGIGAYVTGLLQIRVGLPFIPSCLVAALVTMAIGMVFALPALRMSGIYLAISTIALEQAVHWIMLNWTSMTFGASGFRAPTFTLGTGLSAAQSSFIVALVVCLVAYVSIGSLMTTSFGRRFVAVRDNQVAAASMGVNVTQTKAIAFAISACCAGIAGGLFSSMLGFVAPESFNLDQMILMQIMIVVGGLGTMGGSILGVVVVILMQEFLRDSPGMLEVVFGVLLLGCVLFMPRGMASFLSDARNRRKRRMVADFPRNGERVVNVDSGGSNA